mmetsp:Transcript_47718/g.113382  ORF Transcript_47718/g.113382 Transcript_47718/m.113382 type:complete len:265 (-) Transcript_47718:582-1376(-)
MEEVAAKVAAEVEAGVEVAAAMAAVEILGKVVVAVVVEELQVEIPVETPGRTKVGRQRRTGAMMVAGRQRRSPGGTMTLGATNPAAGRVQVTKANGKEAVMPIAVVVGARSPGTTQDTASHHGRMTTTLLPTRIMETSPTASRMTSLPTTTTPTTSLHMTSMIGSRALTTGGTIGRLTMIGTARVEAMDGMMTVVASTTAKLVPRVTEMMTVMAGDPRKAGVAHPEITGRLLVRDGASGILDLVVETQPSLCQASRVCRLTGVT